MVTSQGTLPERIPNMQLCYVASYLRDWHYSVLKSQAADNADGFPILADMTRLKDRVADMQVQWEFLNALPLLDCPESHGLLTYEVPLLDELPEPENKDIKLLANMLEMIHREFVTCQSARMITGIQAHDYERGVTYLENIQTLIDNYIDPRTPNDWPKAAPEEDRVGAGRSGV